MNSLLRRTIAVSTFVLLGACSPQLKSAWYFLDADRDLAIALFNRGSVPLTLKELAVSATEAEDREVWKYTPAEGSHSKLQPGEMRIIRLSEFKKGADTLPAECRMPIFFWATVIESSRETRVPLDGLETLPSFLPKGYESCDKDRVSSKEATLKADKGS